MTKLYINTDVAVTLTPGTGFTMSDVVSASVQLTHSETEESLVLTSGAGQISLNVSDMTVNIPDSGGITDPGVYWVRITFTDSQGNIRGLTPDTETLKFWK